MNINTLLDIAAFSPKFAKCPPAKLGHLPFLAWLIREMAPGIFVELGANEGNSYFACCQSVAEGRLPTNCYAVDTWQRSEESSQCEDEVFTALAEHNEGCYAAFSQLLRMTLDEALPRFSDGSIGLMCLGGFHVDEDVSRAFAKWLPKLATGAVVVFHDINVNDSNHGLRRLWEGLQPNYPSHLSFGHANGLGIFQLNNAPIDKAREWLQPGSEDKQRLIAYFEELGARQLEYYDLGVFKSQAKELNKEVANLNEALVERNLAVAESDEALAGRDALIIILKKLITKLDKEIKHIVYSKSWELTKPIRVIRRILETRQLDYGDGYNLPPLTEDPLEGLGMPSVLANQAPKTNEYVPLFKGKPLDNKPAKLLCFYHPFFSGEIKNYRHLESENQLRQTELAKLYGIEGFCFNFGWDNGECHFDPPTLNYLNDDSLDLSFCLSWKNDTWRQQSDSSYQGTSIVQPDNTDDDIAFIQQVSVYMRDSRYIRVDNKPLLLVCRPGLFPSPKKTAGRWRQWCNDQGIGEIYLAYLQVHEAVDPVAYGFDAAIEFPQTVPVQQNLEGQAQQLEGYHNQFLENSCNYQKPGYTLFRSVGTLWDNGEQPGKNNSMLTDFSPRDYQEWLFNAIGDTVCRFDDPKQRLVFINAWNECLGAADLEPDQRYGYSYLEATRMALARKAVIDDPQTFDTKKSVAVVIHSFYETILDEILGYLDNINTIPLKLYVTTPINLFGATRRKLKQHKHSAYVLPVSNRGRDILPFIKIMPEVVKGGHDLLIKVHTKKSIHREDGDLWRKDVFEKLLNEHSLKENIEYLANHPEIGILGPADHIVPMDLYMGSNTARVAKLAARMGIDSGTLQKLNFVAGSMFTARIKAIAPLLNIALSETDYEAETGQIDGTLAHAMERLFSVSAYATQLTTSCPDNIITKNYKYTNKSEDMKCQG